MIRGTRRTMLSSLNPAFATTRSASHPIRRLPIRATAGGDPKPTYMLAMCQPTLAPNGAE